MILESAWYSREETDKPLYVQLYYCIRNEIEMGKIPANHPIPSIRKIKKELGLSSTTVENAYNQLMVEGYIYSIPQKGYYASTLDNSFPYIKPVKEKELSLTKEKYAGEYFDTGLFQFHEWKKIYGRILEDFNVRLLQEGDPQGEPELRKALSDYVYKARGVMCNPEQIIIGAGVQTLLYIFCDITEGMLTKKVAFEEPGFVDVRPVFQKRGFSLHPVRLDSGGIHVESLTREDVSVCYISPSHQFPTGLVMPIQKRVELIKWAEQTNSYILEDDYDSELRFLGRPVPSLFSLDNSGRVINIGSFSTLIAPSLRISYIIVPEQIKVRYQKMIHGYRSTVSMAEQLTLAAYIEEGFFSRHLRRMRKKYSEKLKILISAMTPYQKNITLHHSDTGSFVLLEARNSTAAEAVRGNSKRIGFEMEELWENFFVFQYAKIPEDKIQDFISRIQEESSSRH